MTRLIFLTFFGNERFGESAEPVAVPVVSGRVRRRRCTRRGGHRRPRRRGRRRRSRRSSRRCDYGEPPRHSRLHGHDPHEMPGRMVIPLATLSVLAVCRRPAQPAVRRPRVPHRVARPGVPRGDGAARVDRSRSSASRASRLVFAISGHPHRLPALPPRACARRPRTRFPSSSARSARCSATPTTSTRASAGSSAVPLAAMALVARPGPRPQDHRRRGQRRRAAVRARRQAACARSQTGLVRQYALGDRPRHRRGRPAPAARGPGGRACRDFPILTRDHRHADHRRGHHAAGPRAPARDRPAVGYTFTAATARASRVPALELQDRARRLPVRREPAWIAGARRRLHRRRRRHQPLHGRDHRAAVPDRPARVRAHIDHRVKAYIVWFLLLEGDHGDLPLPRPDLLLRVLGVRCSSRCTSSSLGWGHEQPAATRRRSSSSTPRRAPRSCSHRSSSSASCTRPTPAASRSTSGSSRSGTGCRGTAEVLLFIGFMAAFAIKAPLFPFHTWLPDVHTEAPTAGSVVLAGVILKMGAYGFLRFSFELFPQAVGRLRAAPAHARDDRHRLRRDRRRDADRPETRHRVLVGRAHGLRRSWASSRSRSAASTAPCSRC